MKPILILITFIVHALQSARAADKPKFFATRGEYRLSNTTTLIVSEQEQTPQYTLKHTSTPGSHGGELIGTKPGEPFLIYWDADSQTLWWAAIRNPPEARPTTAPRPSTITISFHQGQRYLWPRWDAV